MRKNRNKITAKKSRLKEKLQKKDYEEITKKIQKTTQKMRETYNKKLKNLPLSLKNVLTNLDDLYGKLKNEIKA